MHAHRHFLHDCSSGITPGTAATIHVIAARRNSQHRSQVLLFLYFCRVVLLLHIPCARRYTMPQFAANLGFLFPEVDLLARYNAAAGAGFRGVETPFPYSVPPEVLAVRLQSCGLTQVLCNLPPGNWDTGERGFGALPGREEAFAESLEQALTYAQVLSCPRLHAMAGIAPVGASRASCEAVL